MCYFPLIALLSVPMAALLPVQAAAKTLTTLFVFSGGKATGAFPEAGLIADRNGNLYGTTSFGGAHRDGAVFELMPPAPGQKDWSEIVLSDFNGSNGDGPSGSLIFDSAGNLYGTTLIGGAHGSGDVYEVSPPAIGQTAWTTTVLYSFDGAYGEGPAAGLLADGAGNLYGTTLYGGTGYGTVFRVSPPLPGQTAWTETVLFAFNGANGDKPLVNLIADKAGKLYGTTYEGGASGLGTVFELSPPAPGQTNWTQTTLFDFSGSDGEYPYAGLLADKAGNLYGTTNEGGAYGFGTVFELTPPLAGQTAWTETVLFSFTGTNDADPRQTLLADKSGNFYGTTTGENSHGYGTVFKLAPPAPGQTAWIETDLVSFDGNNGDFPNCSLIADKAGRLYGTTVDGGHRGKGSVFEVKP